MHYLKCIRVVLPEVSKEFELACVLLLFFSFHYDFQLIKANFCKNLWWGRGAGAAAPPVPLSLNKIKKQQVVIYITLIANVKT